MTVALDTAWHLTDQARGQQEGCGIALSELYRLVNHPVQTLPGSQPGERRLMGYGLTCLIAGEEIRQVAIDGADATNWSEWAAERALFGDSDVATADVLVQAEAARLARLNRMPYQRKKKRKPVAPVVQVSHVIERIHPALRDEITRLVDGDYTRLVIHSPTRVDIKPART